MDTQDIDPTEHTPVTSIFGQSTETFTDAERAMASTQAEDVVIEQEVHEANLTASGEELIAQAEPLEIPTETVAPEAMAEPEAVEAYEADTPVEAPPATNEFVAEGATPFPEAELAEAEVIGNIVEDVVTGEIVAQAVDEAVAEPAPVVAATPEEVVVKPKSKRGFASMTPERRREIAAKGGKSVPKTSRYFYQSHENASNAGKIGGKVKGPRKPKAKPEAVTVAAEPTPTVVEATTQAHPDMAHTPNETTVAAIVAAEAGETTTFESPEALVQDLQAETPVEQTVVEATPEPVVVEAEPEVIPASPIETITEGEPEIPAYLRKLAGVSTETI